MHGSRYNFPNVVLTSLRVWGAVVCWMAGKTLNTTVWDAFLVKKPKKKKKTEDRKKTVWKLETIVWLQALSCCLNADLKCRHIFHVFLESSITSKSVTSSHPIRICFISSGIGHPLLEAEAYSNQWRQKASVLLTMPAASNLICQMVPFSKFNLREIQDAIQWLLQLVGCILEQQEVGKTRCLP